MLGNTARGGDLMSTPLPRVNKHQIFIDADAADQLHKQRAKRAYIVQEICRRCLDQEHGLLFPACRFESGECVLETIGKLVSRRTWDDRFADMEISDSR